MRRRLIASFIICALAALSLAPAAVATKPPVDRLDRLRDGVLSEPCRAAGIQTLTDQKDADYAALQPAYRQKTLTNLDGSGYLVGDWANIRNETGTPAYSPTNTFNYHRDDDRFEQVMAYYWVTEAQKYIQSLGFGVTRRAVNKEFRTSGPTSTASTTRSRGTSTTSCASARAGSTMPRTPR